MGYVAPSFAGSQLRQFITPILENHDPDTVEVVLYPADATPALASYMLRAQALATAQFVGTFGR